MLNSIPSEYTIIDNTLRPSPKDHFRVFGSLKLSKEEFGKLENIQTVLEDLLFKTDLKQSLKLEIYQPGSAPGFDIAKTSPVDAKLDFWVISLNLGSDIFKNYSQTQMVFLHEFGHIISLNQNQIDVTADNITAKNKCPTLEVIEGCLKKDSVLLAYYRDFWQNNNNKYTKI
jgi:hypothetical protein